MKIDNCIQTQTSIKRKHTGIGEKTKTISENTPNKYGEFSYPAVYFCGKINPKRVEIAVEKAGLIKDLKNILKNDVTEKEMSQEEKLLNALNKMVAEKLRREKKEDYYMTQMQIIIDGQGKNRQARINEAQRLRKEIRKMYKPKKVKGFTPSATETIKPESNIDFTLINKFRSAVMDDNFDLKRVFKNHYSKLNDITSLEELKSVYPKMPLPKHPKDVVANRISSSLTREFYEGLDETLHSGNTETAKEYIANHVKNILSVPLNKNTDKEKDTVFGLVIPSVTEIVSEKYRTIRENNSFASLPVVRKVKQPLITPLENRLLINDYDKFVLSVLREQYLGFKKTADVVYHNGKNSIKVSELRGSDYKFEKIPETINTILSRGENLKNAQRDYEHFTPDEFKKRLEFYGDRLDSDELFLDKIISFSECNFEPEDVEMLIVFSKEADKALDGEKSIKEVIQYVHKNDIKPIGTERTNQLARKKRFDAMKSEQKKFTELSMIQSEFDENMDILYKNNMAYTAEICSNYRPTSLDKSDAEHTKYLTELLGKYADSKTGKIENKERVAAAITRWDKYNEYVASDLDKDILKKAQEYAKTSDGNIDYDKAGKYIINSEAVITYPECLEFARDKESAKTIIEEYSHDTDKAVEYLCKYDDYLDLTKDEKSKITNILKVFDPKDTMDKSLLKTIIEKQYITVPTSDWTVGENSQKVLSTIAPEAKKDILDYYKFPKCIDFFKAFEEALKQFAPAKGMSGIKNLGRNNKNFKDIYELKIKLSDDRILCRNGDYYFNEFKKKGFH